MVFIVFSTINSLIAQLLYLVRDTKPPILFSPKFAKTEKKSWKKLGNKRMIVWWFDVTNKIFIKNEITLGKPVKWQ